MPLGPSIDAAIGAIAARLAAQLPGVPVEEERRSGINEGEVLPRLVVRLGPIDPDEQDTFGITRYQCEATIEGYTRAAIGAADPDRDLRRAILDLHGRCDAALTAQEIAYGLDGDTIFPEAGRLEPDAPLLEASAEALGGFTWLVRFDLRVTIGAGPFTTTS